MVAYWVSVRRATQEEPLHVYAYGRERASDGFFTYDSHTGSLYPSDREGRPVSRARLTVNGEVEEQADFNGDAWHRFIEAGIGVVSAVRRGEPAPDQADRVFG